LIVLDEMDALTPKRDNLEDGIKARLVTPIVSYMKDVTLEKTGGKHVIIIGATNRPEGLDPELRIVGIFDREFRLNMSDEGDREKYLLELL